MENQSSQPGNTFASAKALEDTKFVHYRCRSEPWPHLTAKAQKDTSSALLIQVHTYEDAYELGDSQQLVPRGAA